MGNADDKVPKEDSKYIRADQYCLKLKSARPCMMVEECPMTNK